MSNIFSIMFVLGRFWAGSGNQRLVFPLPAEFSKAFSIMLMTICTAGFVVFDGAGNSFRGARGVEPSCGEQSRKQQAAFAVAESDPQHGSSREVLPGGGQRSSFRGAALAELR